MTNRVNVSIPQSDMPFFRKLSKKMGWTYSSTSATGEKARTLKSIEVSFRELKSAQSSNRSLPTIDKLFEEIGSV